MEIKPAIVGEIGSHAHGLATPMSDHDYHGIFIESPAEIIGLVRPWEQRREALKRRDQPEGVKSEPGDCETTYYGLQNYVRLALTGNPTILTLLFTPMLKVPDTIGLQANRHLFISRNIAQRHVKYAQSMRDQLTGVKPPRTNRPDLIMLHGYDTKAAFHALRLLIQGYELLTTGGMRMPMLGLQRTYLMAVRKGQVPKEAVLDTIDHHKLILEASADSSPLPVEPNYDDASAYLIDTYRNYWSNS